MQASRPGVLQFLDSIPYLNLHLQMLPVVRPNLYRTIKWHTKDNEKHNIFLKEEALEKQKPGSREAKSGVPQKETAMTWFSCQKDL